MFRSVATFELRYQLKSPAFWVTFAMFLLLTFVATASDNVQIGSGGNVLKNSPYAIAETLHDHERLRHLHHDGVRRQRRDARRRDRLRPDHPFDARVAFRLPVRPLHRRVRRGLPGLPERAARHDAGCGDAVARSRDHRCRSGLGHYLLGIFPALRADAVRDGRRLLRARHRDAFDDVDLRRRHRLPGALPRGDRRYFAEPEFESIVALLDPFGLGAFDAGHQVLDRDRAQHAAAGIAGHILSNRCSGSGIAFALLGVAWSLYARAAKGSRMAMAKTLSQTTRSDPTPASLPNQRRLRSRPCPGRARHGIATTSPGWGALWALARFDMAAAVRSPAFIVLLGVGFLNSIGALWYADERYGNTIHPVTRVMIEALQGAFTYHPADHRDLLRGRTRLARPRTAHARDPRRDAGAGLGVRGAEDPRDLASCCSRHLLSSMLAAIVVQALKGHFDFELGDYLALVRAAVDASTSCCTRCSRSSCRRWCRTSSSAGC